MPRSSNRIFLGILLGLALLAMISLGSAARSWTTVWQGLDQLTMSLQTVQVADDYSTVTITTRFINHSDEPVHIYELDTGLRLTGRSISAQSDRFDDLQLDPGESITFDSELAVAPQDMSVLEERLVDDGQRWNVNGRVSVSVSNLSEPVWLPFRYEMDVE